MFLTDKCATLFLHNIFNKLYHDSFALPSNLSLWYVECYMQIRKKTTEMLLKATTNTVCYEGSNYCNIEREKNGLVILLINTALLTFWLASYCSMYIMRNAVPSQIACYTLYRTILVSYRYSVSYHTDTWYAYAILYWAELHIDTIIGWYRYRIWYRDGKFWFSITTYMHDDYYDSDMIAIMKISWQY